MRSAPLLLLLAGCATTGIPLPDRARWIDLTHPFDARTIYWPTAPSGFVLEQLHFGATPGGWFYAANRFCAPEHGGTHLDAPVHFAADRSTADRVPLRHFAAPAVVLDLRAAAARDPDALLGADGVTAFERAHGAIAPGTIVLVRSGWSARWPDKKRYLGDDTPGDASHLHFPGVDEAAARLLVARGVAAVGIDTASIDHGPSRDFRAHRVLLGADIPVFENLDGLDALPSRGAFVIALPMDIAGGSGAPLRIVAVVP
jgi:kynurenine formamidase